jgi:hypothetical protein
MSPPGAVNGRRSADRRPLLTIEALAIRTGRSIAESLRRPEI